MRYHACTNAHNARLMALYRVFGESSRCLREERRVSVGMGGRPQKAAGRFLIPPNPMARIFIYYNLELHGCLDCNALGAIGALGVRR